VDQWGTIFDGTPYRVSPGERAYFSTKPPLQPKPVPFPLPLELLGGLSLAAALSFSQRRRAELAANVFRLRWAKGILRKLHATDVTTLRNAYGIAETAYAPALRPALGLGRAEKIDLSVHELTEELIRRTDLHSRPVRKQMKQARPPRKTGDPVLRQQLKTSQQALARARRAHRVQPAKRP
jgi:hypothetical protein